MHKRGSKHTLLSHFEGKRIRDATLSIIIHSFTFAP